MNHRIDFSHQFKGTIWNMVADAEQNWLVLEVRDDSTYTTTFHCIDLSSNTVVWSDLELDEKWWITLVSVREGMLLLQVLEGNGNPEVRELCAVDLVSRKVLWSVERFSFYAWGQNSQILGFVKNDDLVKASVEGSSGKVLLGEWSTGVLEVREAARIPDTFYEGTDHFSQVSSFFKKLEIDAISIGVEYLESDNRIMISYYLKKEQGLANYLLVTDSEGNMLFHEVLGENLAGLGVHTFFTLRDCLIFVKNKSVLVSYRLYD